jgi:hypothetical protein
MSECFLQLANAGVCGAQFGLLGWTPLLWRKRAGKIDARTILQNCEPPVLLNDEAQNAKIVHFDVFEEVDAGVRLGGTNFW